MSDIHDISNVKRLFKDDNNNVAWVCLKEIGEPVEGDDNWITSRTDRFPLFNGYQAVRVVRNATDFYKIICSIDRSSLGIPIFRCHAYQYDKPSNKFSDECCKSLSLSGTKITTVSNDILKKYVNVCTNHKWQGKAFFGLDRKDVRAIQK